MTTYQLTNEQHAHLLDTLDKAHTEFHDHADDYEPDEIAAYDRIHDETVKALTSQSAEPILLAMNHALTDIATMDFEDWPGHLTCGEANTIAAAIALVDPEQAECFLLAHSEADTDEEDEHGETWRYELLNRRTGDPEGFIVR